MVGLWGGVDVRVYSESLFRGGVKVKLKGGSVVRVFGRSVVGGVVGGVKVKVF